MLQGLYHTTLEFFALRNLFPPEGQPEDEIDQFTRYQLDPHARRFPDSDSSSMRRGLESQLARSQAEVVRLQERCVALERALKGTREVLEAKEAELARLRRSETPRPDSGQWRSMVLEEEQARRRSTEVFMTRTDALPGQQMVQAVLDLNSEIIQFATSAIELCTFEARTDASTQAIQDTRTRLGPNIARILEAWQTGNDPTLVGLALQACIATCIARAVGAFALGLPTKAETTLSQVYSHIFFSEPQPTSARWRAITHRHVHTLYPGLAEYSAEELKETMCRWSADILLAAGAESMSRLWVKETFGDQVGRMVRAVLAFSKHCKEGILSSNFDMVVIEGNQVFDGRVMVDLFEQSEGGEGVRVLATTELGLRRMTRRTEREDAAEEGTVEHSVLVKPRVFTENALAIL
ncbi:CRAL-TRIO-N domain-containing protein [Mycena kentingensis (nom. inval.)]|nr:CRAL-TRIO-N domain-containing protein [Mycena kentingensis (nom. inval.)]